MISHIPNSELVVPLSFLRTQIESTLVQIRSLSFHLELKSLCSLKSTRNRCLFPLLGLLTVDIQLLFANSLAIVDIFRREYQFIS